MKPCFDLRVLPGGYAWWYLDALSDDGRHGLTIIAFIGSVFSPYYARARSRCRGLADPMNHCAMNVALYAGNGPAAGQPGSTGWAMTERAGDAVQRDRSRLCIGPSEMHWDGGTLNVSIDERTAPWGKRLRGTVRLHPAALLERGYALDAAGRHHWSPMAPRARVEVEFDKPGLRWSGTGYLDANTGERALEQDFVRWDWSRAALSGRRSAVLYDVTRRDGSPLSLALEFDAMGRVHDFAPPQQTALPASAWRVARTTRSDKPDRAWVEQTLEDGPFYARSLLRTELLGEPAKAVHESLSLQRWVSPLVQMMLPFRMPRRA